MDTNPEVARYCFKTSESSDGTPWIYFEPSGREAPSLSKRIIGFDLKPGTTVADADRIARFMNENLLALRITRL